MPISKKDRIQREHKKAEAAGTRAPVKANGLPVKAPKPMSICANCRKEMVSTNLTQLEQHADTHAGWTKERCWPKDFTGGATPTVVAKPEVKKAADVKKDGNGKGGKK